MGRLYNASAYGLDINLGREPAEFSEELLGDEAPIQHDCKALIHIKKSPRLSRRQNTHLDQGREAWAIRI